MTVYFSIKDIFTSDQFRIHKGPLTTEVTKIDQLKQGCVTLVSSQSRLTVSSWIVLT